MENIRIRDADENDLPALLQFEQGIIEAERPFDPTLKPGNVHYYNLQAMLRDTNTKLAVADIDGKLVACGYARLEKSRLYLLHDFHAYLGFMYVVPAYRGSGINQKILESLTDWASSKGVTELRLEVYSENRAAIRAYEKAGFKNLMIQMRMAVEKR